MMGREPMFEPQRCERLYARGDWVVGNEFFFPKGRQDKKKDKQMGWVERLLFFIFILSRKVELVDDDDGKGPI